jgi:hypothetical protein
MPLNSRQLADLVNRAKLRPPPVVSPPPASPQRSERPRQVTPVPQAAAAMRPPPSTAKTLTLRPKVAAVAPTAPPPPLPSPSPQSERAAAAEDFPVGWELKKESWHFHRRFHAIFRRPMRHGEYSYLLHQIPNRAEHLVDDCWRVTLPDSQRTLAVRATKWRLLTILPKDWQPPARVEQSDAGRSGG